VSDDFPIRSWEHDHDEETRRLYEHGYHHVEGFEGVWQLGDEEPVTRKQALEGIDSRYD
jgi:hypothetical protein